MGKRTLFDCISMYINYHKNFIVNENNGTEILDLFDNAINDKNQICCRPLKLKNVLLLPGEIFLEDICRLSAVDIHCPQTYLWYLQFPKFQDVQYNFISRSLIKFFYKRYLVHIKKNDQNCTFCKKYEIEKSYFMKL